MLDSLPALAHRVTVFGSTRKSAATSAGVSSASGAGAVCTLRLADMPFHLSPRSFPRRDRILAEVLNILEASNRTDHSNLGLFSAPPSRTIGNSPPALKQKGRRSQLLDSRPRSADQRSLRVRYRPLERSRSPSSSASSASQTSPADRSSASSSKG